MIVRPTLLVVGVVVLIAGCGESSGSGAADTSLATGAPPTLATLPPASTTTSTPVSTPSDCRNVDTVTVPPPADLAIQVGDCGPGVQQVQQLLADLGYPIGVDGDFGPATQGYVRQYETNKGLPVDGIVDAEMFTQLDYDATP